MKPIDINSIPRDESFADKLDLLEPETIRILIGEADARLSALESTCQGILSKCTSFLGWAIASFASLCAVLVSFIVSGSPSHLLLAMTIYGVIAVAAVIAVLFTGPLTGCETYGPGGMPSEILRKDVFSQLEGSSKKTHQTCILGWYLMDLQQKIDFDKKANDKLVSWYRMSILVFVGAVAGGFLLLGVLCLFI